MHTDMVVTYKLSKLKLPSCCPIAIIVYWPVKMCTMSHSLKYAICILNHNTMLKHDIQYILEITSILYLRI